jgi:anti-anti-sigma factor
MNTKSDYSAMARTNPVFMTAKTAVCLMAQAEIPDAERIVRSLKIENKEPLQDLSGSAVILGNALVVEAKYRTMCSLIENSGYRTCVDLPCGYTPKALHLTSKGIHFVGLDLPIVVQEMESVMHSLAAYPERMAFHPVDATNYDSLDAALEKTAGPLCITTEGMMMYFTESELEAVVNNVCTLLEVHGGAWFTPDPEFMIQFFLTFQSLFGEDWMKKLEAAGNAAMKQSDVANLSNSFILDAADIPGSVRRTEAFLAKFGLKAEKLNLAEHMPELSTYRFLTSEQIVRFRKAMGNCYYWVITLDGARKRRNVITEKEQSFAMHYTMENGIFRVSLCGRLDSITAPELLLEWEKEKVATNIEKVIVDFERLTYISSAGVRVLLTMQEKTKCGVTLIHVSPPVKKLLEQHENLSFAQ